MRNLFNKSRVIQYSTAESAGACVGYCLFWCDGYCKGYCHKQAGG